VTVPFSVLLPVYRGDRAERFRAAFASTALQQTLPPDEVVIVRDGPVGPELAAALDEVRSTPSPRVVVVELEENVGLAAALSAGLAACGNDVVARMDADDESMPTRFERQIAELERRGLDLLGGGMFEVAGSDAHVVGRRIPPVGHEEIVRVSSLRSPFNHPTIVFRKAAVEAVGGYVEAGKMEDYWLFARLLHAGAAVDNLPDPVLRYRVDEGAYERRGGIEQFRTELGLQRMLRAEGYLTTPQFVRNVMIRGTYRLLPPGLRRPLYRKWAVTPSSGDLPDRHVG
jgi:glycosyltransferase involved in cell wall biosynthesis